MPITMFIGNIAYVAICILGGYFAVKGNLTVGGIQAFVQYVRSYTQPITQIANISNVLQQTAAAAERVFEFLEEKQEPEEARDALSINRGDNSVERSVEIKGTVDFEDVSFGYNPDKQIGRASCRERV